MKKTLIIITVVFYLLSGSVLSQDLKYERARYKGMLGLIKSEIAKKYYDAQFQGNDLEANYKQSIDSINKSTSAGEMTTLVAQFMLNFNDSHTFFLPPQRVTRVEYGWDMIMIGDKCYVVEVAPDSDAAKQGLKPGDQIYWMEGFEPTRESIWQMNYYYRVLNPQAALRVIAIKPDGKKIQYVLKAKMTAGKSVVGVNVDDWKEYELNLFNELKKERKHRFYSQENGLFIWKMPSFNFAPEQVDDFMGKAKNSKDMIVDLRGNGGGLVITLNKLLGYFFTENIKIADYKQRKELYPDIVKSHGKNGFTGKVVVLLDSDSASAAEIFARVMQLEKRGVVIGDQSSGKVMTSQTSFQKDGVDYVAYYGYSITVADVVMKDGKSLERMGVIPDEKILPTALDLANERDPVLAKAAQLLGYNMTSEQAGKMFPREQSNGK